MFRRAYHNAITVHIKQQRFGLSHLRAQYEWLTRDLKFNMSSQQRPTLNLPNGEYKKPVHPM
jgi:hypothetical protein